MHSPSGVELAGLASLLVAVPAVALLANSGAGTPARPAGRTCCSPRVARSPPRPRWPACSRAAHRARTVPRPSLGSAVAPWRWRSARSPCWPARCCCPAPRRARAPRCGTCWTAWSIAAALWFVGWVLVSEPTRILGDATPMRLPAGAAAGRASPRSPLGLTTVLACTRTGPGMITVRVAGGVTMVAVAATALSGGICQDWPTSTCCSARCCCPAGLVVVARAVKVADRPVDVVGDVTERGTAYAFVPMVATVGSLGYHIVGRRRLRRVRLPRLRASRAWRWSARQYLALADVRRYTLQLRQREAHFRELAHTDPLTGLANRRGLVRALREPRRRDRARVLVGLDLDGFKNVNDMRGHDVGDAVLAEVGERLRRNLRDGDVAARLGGDEFAVLMRGHRRGGDARGEAAARGARRAVRGGRRLGLPLGERRRGHSPAPGDTGELMRDADLALRYAKQRGKNRVERYQKRYDELLRRHSMLESELRHAIDREQLRLVFQPVVALPSMRPVGAEALLRWHHPDARRGTPGRVHPGGRGVRR